PADRCDGFKKITNQLARLVDAATNSPPSSPSRREAAFLNGYPGPPRQFAGHCLEAPILKGAS
ncbi:MAG: hypothetical protein ACJ8FD_24280, partial [Bradyrhizobium canariense]